MKTNTPHRNGSRFIVAVLGLILITPFVACWGDTPTPPDIPQDFGALPHGYGPNPVSFSYSSELSSLAYDPSDSTGRIEFVEWRCYCLHKPAGDGDPTVTIPNRTTVWLVCQIKMASKGTHKIRLDYLGAQHSSDTTEIRLNPIFTNAMITDINGNPLSPASSGFYQIAGGSKGITLVFSTSKPDDVFSMEEYFDVCPPCKEAKPKGYKYFETNDGYPPPNRPSEMN